MGLISNYFHEVRPAIILLSLLISLLSRYLSLLLKFRNGIFDTTRWGKISAKNLLREVGDEDLTLN